MRQKLHLYVAGATSLCSKSYVYMQQAATSREAAGYYLMQLWLRLYVASAASIRNFCYVLTQKPIYPYCRVAAYFSSVYFIINLQHISLSEINVAINFMV